MGKQVRKDPAVKHKLCTECRKEIFGLPAEPEKQGKTNQFNSFPQREYSQNQMNNMEQRLLNRNRGDSG